MKKINITDETASGKILNEIALKFDSEYITVEELITARIKAEVVAYNNNIGSCSSSLVIPTDLQQRLNRKEPKPIDIEKQVYVALDAFKTNGFFILVDNEQVEELDQKFLVDKSTSVSFIKLTPLVGG